MKKLLILIILLITVMAPAQTQGDYWLLTRQTKSLKQIAKGLPESCETAYGKSSLVDFEKDNAWIGSATLNPCFQYPDIYKTGIAIAAIANQLTYDNIYQEAN